MDRSSGWGRTLPAALALAAVVALAACSDDAGIAGSDTAAACGEVEQVDDQGHHHLVGDAEPPIAYNSTPPTSGWHPRGVGAELLGVHDEPLSEPQQVGVLAVDAVVVAYAGLDADQRAALAEFVDDSDRPVALTPYDALDDGQVAMTAWNVKQQCDGVDLDTVAAFVDAHAADEPDFTMGGEDPAGGDHDHDDAGPADADDGDDAAEP